MTPSGIILLSLLSFVVASDHEVPYVQSVKAIDAGVKQLEDYVLSMEDDIPGITDPRRHYAVMVTHVVRAADIFLHHIGVPYVELYMDSLADSVVIGLTDVEDVIKTTKEILDILNSNTEKILTLINTLCPAKTPAGVCNQIIEQAVNGDPKRYLEEAKLLLDAGQVAKELLNTEFVAVAEVYDEIPYLINHMDDLIELIVNLSEIMSKYSPQ